MTDKPEAGVETAGQENIAESQAAEEQVNQQEAGGEQQEQQTERDFEAEALEMGWTPKEQFRGDPAKFVDAKTFVEKGETFVPFLKATNKKLQDRLAKTESDFDQRIKRMEDAQQRREKALKSTYDRELSRIKAEQRKAVAEGDTAAFDVLDKEREELTKQADEAFAEARTEQPRNDAAVEKEWIAENQWYRTDFELAAKANTYSRWLADNNSDMSLADNLKATEKYIREQHPDKFGGKTKPKGNGHAGVDGGSSFPAAPFGKKVKGYADLPAEAKELCARDVADKLYKDRDEWAKEYWKNG